jgi:predicted nucleotidyltransferase component of viral defense system
MIDVIKQKIAQARSQEEKLNKTRELLQLLVLKIIFDRGYFNNIVFTGGTALRIIYDLKRFSEDLDFSLTEKKGYSFVALAETLKNDLEKYGLAVEMPAKDAKTVNAGMIKFPGILNELGLASNRHQKLAVKLEVDTNPPHGGKTMLTPVTSSYIFVVNHFDLPSLFATKLHACFFRKYAKGRDYYDLIWYLGKKVKPNFVLLNNAIRQTQGDHQEVSPLNINEMLQQRISKLDLAVLKNDVERFLEDKNELHLFDKNILERLVESADFTM